VASMEHRVRGLWAIDTVNPNAWAGLTEYIGLSSANMVVGQEAKQLDEETMEGEATMRAKGWKAMVEPCCSTELEGKSAGVAVAVRKHIGMSRSMPIETVPMAFRSRCRLAFVIAVTRGGFHLGSIYLVSSVGVKAKKNLDILDAVAATLKALAGRWVLGGDFNCTPEQLTATGWLKVVGGVIVAPTAAN
jgi:endonuclease/exonuclease/phosphatase family metal-dependent hydrolase